MALSREAVTALIRLEGGARFNCIHATARELIEAGMAFDGWGALEITEMGRRAARTFRSFTADDDNIANVGDRSEPRFETPINSHGVVDPDFELAPIAPADAPARIDVPQTIAATASVGRELPWSRERVGKAAGIANGSSGVWVDAAWVAAFMDAYEEL